MGTGEHGPVEDKEQMKHRQSPTRRNPGSSSAVSGKFMILSQLNHRRRLRRIPKVSKSSGESQIGSIPGGTCAGQPAVSSLLASRRHLHLETRAHGGEYAHAIASIKTRQTHAGACSRYQLRDGPLCSLLSGAPQPIFAAMLIFPMQERIPRRESEQSYRSNPRPSLLLASIHLT